MIGIEKIKAAMHTARELARGLTYDVDWRPGKDGVGFLLINGRQHPMQSNYAHFFSMARHILPHVLEQLRKAEEALAAVDDRLIALPRSDDFSGRLQMLEWLCSRAQEVKELEGQVRGLVARVHTLGEDLRRSWDKEFDLKELVSLLEEQREELFTAGYLSGMHTGDVFVAETVKQAFAHVMSKEAP